MQPLKLKKPLLALVGLSLSLGALTLIGSIRSVQSAPTNQNFMFHEICEPLTARSLIPQTPLYDESCDQPIATVQSYPNRDQQVMLRLADLAQPTRSFETISSLTQSQGKNKFFVKRIY